MDDGGGHRHLPLALERRPVIERECVRARERVCVCVCAREKGVCVCARARRGARPRRAKLQEHELHEHKLHLQAALGAGTSASASCQEFLESFIPACRARPTLQREIKCKNPQLQYSLYQERGFLDLISGARARSGAGTRAGRPRPCARSPLASRPPSTGRSSWQRVSYLRCSAATRCAAAL